MRIPLVNLLFAICTFFQRSIQAQSNPEAALGPNPQAPPVAPLSVVRETPAPVLRFIAPAALTQYSIGTPTDEEQLYLELINHARANPAGEAQRIRNSPNPEIQQALSSFKVDLDLMVSDISAISAAPPLSFNANLIAAARGHSQDMFDNQFQGHCAFVQGDICDPFERFKAAGYDYSAGGENVFSFIKSVEHGHAGFEVDWGGDESTGGMQEPPGHRNSIHKANFREVGIGVILGVNGVVGPQVVTQDFGSRLDLKPFITGVVYYDFNGNGFYDLAEGIGGVKITVSGSSFSAITANSGGYSVPVPANGNYTATFSAAGLPDTPKSAAVANANNSKLDYSPVYSPPGITGPDKASINQNNAYLFSVVGGATGYQWKQSKLAPYTLVEGAETGAGNLTIQASPGYNVIQNDVKATSSSAFHLAHPEPPIDQTLTLNRQIKLGSASELKFSSRLGWATTGQIARAQISTDGGRTWKDVWIKAGNDTSGESAFSTQTIALTAFAGADAMIRFVYDFVSGSFFFNTDPGVGFYLDDITVTAAQELTGEVVTDVTTGTSFNFKPMQTGDYSLSVRAKISDRFLGYGPAKLVTAQVGPSPGLSVKINAIQLLTGNQVQIDFDLVSGFGASFQLQSALSPTGPWAAEATATINPLQPVGSPTKYRAMGSTGGVAERYYQILAN